jgi:uncharacterized membrane protein YccF (DUF307 family)
LLLNILWVVLGGGFVIAIEYAIGGLLLCLTVVGIPFGVQCFKVAGFGFWPFGRTFDVDDAGLAGGAVRLVFNVLWFLVAGLWIFLSHLVLAVGLAVTIIGIPFAVQHLKLGVLALAPFGKRLH